MAIRTISRWTSSGISADKKHWCGQKTLEYHMTRMCMRRFSTARVVQAGADFTHTIIGGGVVGLAVGAKLVEKNKNHKVLIIEKNQECGQETSSRNSEVVHAGLYYPVESLKTKLCILGKTMIYERKDFIPVRQCGKWIIAQNEEEMEYLTKLHKKSQELHVPTEFVTLKRGKLEEPLINASVGILNSPTTGITSAHGIMDYLFMKFQQGAGSGDIVYDTAVTGLSFNKGRAVFEVETNGGEGIDDEARFIVSSNNVINCAGLNAPNISNLLLPSEKAIKPYYAKGNYFSYNGPNLNINRLVYPCPKPGVASLGTHLTIDLGGQIRFGPDLEWVDEIGYKVNEKNLDRAVAAVSEYLPQIKREYLHGSYSGIRPKLHGPEHGQFQDFVIRHEGNGFYNLLGIESPGLTASMGIAEYLVEEIM